MSRDLIIVGGGLAGASAAILMAPRRDVVLIERDAGPKHKVCGEFLSPEAQDYLARLGIDLAGLGAVPIRRLRIVADDRVIELDLPFTGMSLSRLVLDEALLALAAKAGAEIRRDERVVGVTREGAAWRARLDRGSSIGCAELLLATGKHDVRGLPRPAGLHPGMVGFKQYLRLSASYRAEIEASVELYLFDGGYAGLEPVERDQANLCLVVERRVLAASGQDWPGLLEYLRRLSPRLAARLDGSVALMARPVAVADMPYGHIRYRADGIWRLGDQAAVIPSLTGDGMAIALHSAALAADMLSRGRSAEDYQRRLARDVVRPVGLATLVSRALVKSTPRRGLAAAARRFPGLVTSMARYTRLPEGRLMA